MNMVLRMAELEAKFSREALADLPVMAPREVRQAAECRAAVGRQRFAAAFAEHMRNQPAAVSA